MSLIKTAPVSHTARSAPVTFRLKGYSKETGELHYVADSSRMAVRPADAIPSRLREGHLGGGGGVRAPLARSTEEGVAIPVRGLRGEGAVEVSLEAAAQEMATAQRRLAQRSADRGF